MIGVPIDWDAPWLSAMRGVAQDPIHHAEGDVFVHTKMVMDALERIDAYRALPGDARAIVRAGALLHDVGKPDTTRAGDDGRVTSHGHSTRGAILARRILWRLGVPFPAREAAVALVRHHQAPFWLLERDDPRSLVARITQTARADLLALVAEADARGRRCADQARILDNIALFRTYADEAGCLHAPFAFPSDHARFLFFASSRSLGDPTYAYAPREAFRCDAIVMSGLPASGKDTVLRERFPGLPVVSLDRIRAEDGVDPADDQGPVVARAREEARGHLRASRAFAWNATNLSRRVRGQVIRLLAAYDARVHVVYVETDEATLRARNRARAGKAVVPDRVIDALLDRWEIPDLTEAHEVTYVTDEP